MQTHSHFVHLFFWRLFPRRKDVDTVPVTEDLFVLSELKKFYLSLGFGEVVVTTPEKHDKMIAYTSQLCHVVSNAFIKSDSAREHGGYSAGSYRDLTRVARLDPVMWSELMEDNRDYLSGELDVLIENLTKYRDALACGDEDALRTLLAEGDNRLLGHFFCQGRLSPAMLAHSRHPMTPERAARLKAAEAHPNEADADALPEAVRQAFAVMPGWG